MKRSLLALTIAATSFHMAQAAPFMPMDARGLAMGNTGVASAKRAHAPAYNPSLLSQANANDDFSIIFPQVGVAVSDEKMIIKQADDINDKIFPQFEHLVTDGENSLEKNLKGLEQAISRFENIDLSLSTPNITTNVEDYKNELKGKLTELRAGNQEIANSAQLLSSNLQEVDLTVNELTKSLQSISDNPVLARLGVSGAVAVPSKKLAVAVTANTSANISARIRMSPRDLALLNAYAPAAQEYTNQAIDLTGDIDNTFDDLISSIDSANTQLDLLALKDRFENDTGSIKNDALDLKNFNSTTLDPEGNPIIQGGSLSAAAEDPKLSSTAEVVGVGVVEIGLSFAREIELFNERIAIGVTPKLQKIYTFHYGNQFENFDDLDSDVIKDSRLDYTDFNFDIGASYRFGANENWMAGAVIKNALGGSYRYQDTVFTDVNTGTTEILEGGKLNLNPQVRGGIAYQSKFFNAAFDLDLIKNKPVAYESATQFASIGVEFDAWKWAQLRAGYRTNLKASGMSTISAGIGFSPFDVFNIDIAAVANTSDFEKEAGAVFEMGLNF